MRYRLSFLCAAALAALVALPRPAARAADLDIKRAAPTDAHTVVYAKKNPERAYQGEYLADAWKTLRDERIAERVYDLIASRAPKEKLDEIKARWDEMAAALEPIELQALVNGEEFVMANVMVGPFGHTIFVVRLTDEDAADYRQGLGQLFEVFQKWSEGKVTTETTDAAGVKTTSLHLPKEVPYQPAAASVGNLFLVATSGELLSRCVAQLQSESGASKFDDPRLLEALKSLPEPEDSLTFFDMRQLCDSMRGLADFICAQKPNDEDAERGAKFVERIVKEIALIDYEVTVEYTEEGQNRAAALGKLSPDVESTILGRALSGGKPFEDWRSWVPANATAYSLTTGISLHEIYAGVLQILRDDFPESHEGLDKWAALQDKVGVNLDTDILQSFSGECVSVTLPEGQSVTALKCSDPDKIRELMDRAIAGLKQIPQIAQQGLDLKDCDDEALAGFKEVQAAALAMTPAKPVIGFKDGWMILASSPAAAKALLAVRAGEADSIAASESLKRFNLNVDGTVYAASYSDIGAQVRDFANGIDMAANMAPMFLGMAAAEAKPEDLKTIQEAIGLLPSLAKVIRKFDFYEQRLSITREGPSEGTYLREAVTLIRQPAAK